MISVYQLKSKFQSILRPMTGSLAKAGITANQVTISAFILSLLTGEIIFLFAPKSTLVFLVLPLTLFIRMALNAIDGMLAREFNQKSNLGAILNELGDVLSDIVIYIPFLYVCSVNVLLIMAIALLAVISEMCGIMGIQIGASRRYDGPMGKSDRAFVFGLLAFVIAFYPIEQKIINILLYIITALLAYTIFNRIKNALKEAN